MIFDIRTILFVNFIINIISASAMAIIWHQYRNRYHGLAFWFAYFGAHTIGIGLILLRGVFPDLITDVF